MMLAWGAALDSLMRTLFSVHKVFFILLLHTIVNKRASIFEINVSCGCASLSGLSPKIFTLHAFAAYLNFAS